MQARLLVAVALVLLTPLCSKGGAAPTAAGPRSGAERLDDRNLRRSGEPDALAGITAAHNAVRARVGAPPLAWDDRLAATAAAWVKRCVDDEAPRGLLDHNARRGAGHRFYVGENIFAGTAQFAPEAVVDSWAAEGDNYDYARNRCTHGRTCGHYTQLVWAATTNVGCAAGYCPRTDYPYVVVCDYGPGGNSGGRPY